MVDYVGFGYCVFVFDCVGVVCCVGDCYDGGVLWVFVVGLDWFWYMGCVVGYGVGVVFVVDCV